MISLVFRRGFASKIVAPTRAQLVRRGEQMAKTIRMNLTEDVVDNLEITGKKYTIFL